MNYKTTWHMEISSKSYLFRLWRMVIRISDWRPWFFYKKTYLASNWWVWSLNGLGFMWYKFWNMVSKKLYKGY